MVTLKDVAKKAGVGIGTASRVLNNQAHVSEDKRNRVLQAIEELNYQPDAIARSLKTKITKNIGVILNDITNPFYSELLRGIETEAFESDYSIVFIDLFLHDYDWIDKVLNFYRSKVDGIIYVGSTVTDDILRACNKCKLPFVYTSANMDVSEATREMIYRIDIDNEKAAYDATQALIEYGHKEIAIILGEEEDRNSTFYRKRGFEKAMAENQLEIKSDWVLYGSFTFDSGYDAMNKIIKSGDLPTVIFAISDLMAIGAAKALLEQGFNIPKDVSLMGFDGIKNSEYYYPEISTVIQPRYEMGKLSCNRVIKLINNEEIGDNEVILKHNVVLRDSLRRI